MDRQQKISTHGMILGARIRQRRRRIGLSQIELARRVGISPSYLNLIEWNKRQIAGTRLRQIADVLGLTVADLAGSSENRLAEELSEIAHLPILDGLTVEEDRIGELVGRFPGWSRAAAALALSEREATARAEVLTDRMSNDPYLGATVHRMLSRIASIRSASEILSEFTDMSPEQKDRFSAIIHEESGRLSEIGEALSGYLDKADRPDRVITPADEVEAVFAAHDNRFENIDGAAGRLNALLSDSGPVSRRAMAASLADQRLGAVIDEVLDAESSRISTAKGRERTKRELFNYAVSAILMPIDLFAARAAETGYDIELLSGSFSADVSAVCHRLTALRGEGVPRFGYFCANAAGTIIEMIGLEGLAVPRYADACPMWALFRAQQSPETIVRQYALFPSGMRFVFLARARQTGPVGFGKPRHFLTDMLIMPEDDAAHTVYAPDASVLLEEVGPGCRLCPRSGCGYRAEDPLSG